ncbi:hypothetical protein ACPOL_3808 [Acidisarcina polymorpha]|uniref:Uncharacterized protein n=1 Tax=Acidisarcina polymorpha TaxID=2211140 RepID=A0A2Z5G343_9BACT|nr:hypothetical protein ACPOL_3808 [Acidisarcina polymorpha]
MAANAALEQRAAAVSTRVLKVIRMLMSSNEKNNTPAS